MSISIDRRFCILTPTYTLLAILLSSLVQISRGGDIDRTEQIRTAVDKSLPLLEISADYSRSERSCFTCHHVSFPAITANAAWQRGFKVDQTNLDAQLKRTHAELTSDVERFLQGRFPNGKGDQIGHAMWLLKDLGWQAEQTTADAVRFLVGHDQDHPTWMPDANRPPTVGSPFTTTFVVLQALDFYQPSDLSYEHRKRRRSAVGWLRETASFDTEDMVYRLRALHLVDPEAAENKTEAQKLLEAQREDGGWAQLPQMNTDAYATGTALAALVDTGQLKTDSPQYQAGTDFLLNRQKEDGSWHVESRTQPRQPFYNSLFPHQKDQFISAAASAWATYALVKSFPVIESRSNKTYLAIHPKVRSTLLADH